MPDSIISIIILYYICYSGYILLKHVFVGVCFFFKHIFHKPGGLFATLGKANNPFTNPSSPTALKF